MPRLQPHHGSHRDSWRCAGSSSPARAAAITAGTENAVRQPGRVCSEPRISLNLLWALEGALSGLHWQEVAREHRTSLLLALEEAERRAG